MKEIQVAGQTPRYECSLCNTKFDHNVKFPHLVGQKHRLNVLVSSSSSCPGPEVGNFCFAWNPNLGSQLPDWY